MIKLFILTYISLCHGGILKNILDYSSNIINFDIVGALNGFSSKEPSDKNSSTIPTDKASIINNILREEDGLAHIENEYPELYEEAIRQEENNTRKNFKPLLEMFNSPLNITSKNNLTNFNGQIKEFDTKFTTFLKSIKEFFHSILKKLDRAGIKDNNSTTLIGKIKNSWNNFMFKFYNMTETEKQQIIGGLKSINKPNLTVIQKTPISDNKIFENIFNQTHLMINDINHITNENNAPTRANNPRHLKIALGCIAILVVLGVVIFLLTNYYRKTDGPTNGDSDSELKEALYQKTQALQFNSNKKKSDEVGLLKAESVNDLSSQDE